jgi:hypothetical protein
LASTAAFSDAVRRVDSTGGGVFGGCVVAGALGYYTAPEHRRVNDFTGVGTTDAPSSPVIMESFAIRAADVIAVFTGARRTHNLVHGTTDGDDVDDDDGDDDSAHEHECGGIVFAGGTSVACRTKSSRQRTAAA